MEGNNKGEKKNPVTYFLDDDPKTTNEKTLTANQILRDAGMDPTINYLKWITGEAQHSYKDRGEEPIHIHEGMKFISIHNGPMTVS